MTRADVPTLGGFPVHAGPFEMIDRAACPADSHPGFILTHGEPKVSESLRYVRRPRLGIKATCPDRGAVITLDAPLARRLLACGKTA